MIWRGNDLELSESHGNSQEYVFWLNLVGQIGRESKLFGHQDFQISELHILPPFHFPEEIISGFPSVCCTLRPAIFGLQVLRVTLSALKQHEKVRFFLGGIFQPSAICPPERAPPKV